MRNSATAVPNEERVVSNCSERNILQVTLIHPLQPRLRVTPVHHLRTTPSTPSTAQIAAPGTFAPLGPAQYLGLSS
jgi:hypothetical protein